MKALIPSGGRGLRLRPITHTSAKQLVPVANRPILFSVLDDVAEAGIVDVAIVVGDTADEIRDAVGDGSAWGLRVTYIEQDAPRGLAHTVLVARDWLGADPFVMYLGDNLLRDGIRELVDAFNAQPVGAAILVAKVTEPQRFGVVELDGARVVRLVEKPAQPRSDLALVGVYLFDSRVHAAIRQLAPSARGELEITDAIQRLVDAGEPVRAHHVTGWWKDTGRKEDLLDANRLVLESMQTRIDGDVDGSTTMDGTVVIARGARVTASVLRGPVVIGEDAVIDEAEIGPYTSIGARCRIDAAVVENSVIMEGCQIRGVRRLVDSLLGRDVTVQGARGDRPVTLMVGDHGSVSC